MLAEADRLHVGDRHIAQHKGGHRVGNAERLQHADLLRIFQCDLVDADLKVRVDRGGAILRFEVLARVFVDLFAEGVDVLAAHRKTRRKLMPAVFFKQVVAVDQRVHKVQPLDASAAALAHVTVAVALRAVERDEDGGQTVFLGDAGGNDPDDAVMPVVGGKHDDRIVCKVVGRVDLGIRLGGDAVFLGLPLTVDVAEPFCQGIGFFARVGEEKLDRKTGGADASRRVDAWRERVADEAGGDALCAGTAAAVRALAHGVDQGAEPDALRMLDAAQAEGDDQAVFIPDGHDVRDRTDGNKVGIVRADAAHRILLGDAGALGLKRAEQLEDNADACQLLERIGAVGAARVDNGGGVRQLAVALVMVGDHHVHAARVRVLDLDGRGDAGVDRDDQPRPLVDELIDRAFTHTVALAHAVGDIVPHIRIECLQIQVENADRGDAVHVVVAVDDDAFPGSERLLNAGDRAIHVAEQHGGMQHFFLHAEEAPRRRAVAADAVGEQPRRDRADAELFCQAFGSVSAAALDIPFLLHVLSISNF